MYPPIADAADHEKIKKVFSLLEKNKDLIWLWGMLMLGYENGRSEDFMGPMVYIQVITWLKVFEDDRQYKRTARETIGLKSQRT